MTCELQAFDAAVKVGLRNRRGTSKNAMLTGICGKCQAYPTIVEAHFRKITVL